MLNPYILGPNRKFPKGSRITNKGLNTQDNGCHAKQPVSPNSLTLRLGRLLIRMGKELTGEGIVPKGTEDSMYPVSQDKTRQARPRRLHHA